MILLVGIDVNIPMTRPSGDNVMVVHLDMLLLQEVGKFLMLCWSEMLLLQVVGVFLLVLHMSLYVLETFHMLLHVLDVADSIGGSSISVGGSWM